MNKVANGSREVGDLYDWMSRFSRVRGAFGRGARERALAVHKALRIPPEMAGKYGGEEVFYIDDRALEAASLAPEPRVLDAGCGLGGTIFRWHDRIGGMYDGLTLSPVERRIAEREARRRKLDAQCRFHLRSYDEPAAPVYDAIVAIESLIFSPDFDRSFANLAAALRPGGKLVIADDIPPRDLSDDEDALRLMNFWGLGTIPSAATYRRAIAQNRLRPVHVADYTDCVDVRSPVGLKRREGIYTAIRFALPFEGARSVVMAFLGGLALERLYLRGRVRYRLLVLRKQE